MAITDPCCHTVSLIVRFISSFPGSAWAARQIAVRKNNVYATFVPLKSHVTTRVYYCDCEKERKKPKGGFARLRAHFCRRNFFATHLFAKNDPSPICNQVAEPVMSIKSIGSTYVRGFQLNRIACQNVESGRPATNPKAMSLLAILGRIRVRNSRLHTVSISRVGRQEIVLADC